MTPTGPATSSVPPSVLAALGDPARAFEPTLFLYDNYPGGIGLSEPLYIARDTLIAGTFALVRDCPCEVGCPACIGPVLMTPERGRSPKQGALDVLACLHLVDVSTANTNPLADQREM